VAAFWRRLLTGPAKRADKEIVGSFDGLVGGVWQGWALDRTMPGRPLTVTLVTSGGRRIETLADHYRADVHRTQPGHGYYGFRVPARLLQGEEPRRIVVGAVTLSRSRTARG